jgi:hypothetical protein
MQRLDVYMAALNAVRFLLIKDSLLSNVTGIWLADTRRTLSTQVLRPLLSISQATLLVFLVEYACDLLCMCVIACPRTVGS